MLTSCLFLLWDLIYPVTMMRDMNWTREDSKKYCDLLSLENLKNSGYNLLVDGGNAYTLKYAQAVTDTPLESSGMSIESYTIPFVGMVLHGYVEYSGVALNQQGSYQKSLLKKY